MVNLRLWEVIHPVWLGVMAMLAIIYLSQIIIRALSRARAHDAETCYCARHVAIRLGLNPDMVE